MIGEANWNNKLGGACNRYDAVLYGLGTQYVGKISRNTVAPRGRPFAGRLEALRESNLSSWRITLHRSARLAGVHRKISRE